MPEDAPLRDHHVRGHRRVVGGTRVLLQTALNSLHDKDVILSGMGMLRDRGPALVRQPRRGRRCPPSSGHCSTASEPRTIRVGYFEDSLPHAFGNTRGALVGFDVEMALQLARDLHVNAEFVKVDRAILDTGSTRAVRRRHVGCRDHGRPGRPHAVHDADLTKRWR